MPRQKSPPPPRSELVALLRACRAEPEDDTPRLVLADWLDEQGEADRAELVRLQCRLSRDENDPDRLALRARERELLGRGITDWLAPFKRPDWYPQFRRGLVRLAIRGTKTSVKSLVALARTEASAWIEHLSVTGITPLAMSELIDSPIAADVRELDAGMTGADEVARMVAATPAFGGLTRLALGDSFTLAGAEAIVGAEHLSGVVDLHLRDSEMGEEGLRLILDAENLSGVQKLSLYGCEFGPAAARALAETSGMPALRSIDLSRNEIGDGGAAALAGCARKSVRELNLYRNAIGDEGLRALAATTGLPGVRAISLGGNGFTDAGMQALADCALLERLTALKFDGPGFTIRGVEALVNSPGPPLWSAFRSRAPTSATRSGVCWRPPRTSAACANFRWRATTSDWPASVRY